MNPTTGNYTPQNTNFFEAFQAHTIRTIGGVWQAMTPTSYLYRADKKSPKSSREILEGIVEWVV